VYKLFLIKQLGIWYRNFTDLTPFEKLYLHCIDYKKALEAYDLGNQRVFFPLSVKPHAIFF
jgi:hypothetical protein